MNNLFNVKYINSAVRSRLISIGVFFSIFVWVTVGCDSNEFSNEYVSEIDTVDTVQIAKTESILESDKKLTSYSRFIAGLKNNLSFADSSVMKSFVKFSDAKNKKFDKIKSTRLDLLRSWNKKNLISKNRIEDAFAFYPFAGGDFIHLESIYPEATDYLMLALEPVGELPSLDEEVTQKDMDHLYAVDKVLRNIYFQSYFITKNMNKDMQGDSAIVNGVLPFILWGMAKTDHEIVSLDYFNIDSTGSAVTCSSDKLQRRKSGVEIKFMTKKDSVLKRLRYLSLDIGDRNIKKNPEIKIYLENAVPRNCNSFVKSASYLMHYSSFSFIRDFILERAAYHLQDDTGIPFKYFNSTWDVQLFGHYTMPVTDFPPDLFQNDLKRAFKDSLFYRGTLDFSMGYHWGSRKQNQMIFMKKVSI